MFDRFESNSKLHSARTPQRSAPQPLPTTSSRTSAAHHMQKHTVFVLLKMGIMMPKTCWDSVDNKHLIVASCWFSLSLFVCWNITRVSLWLLCNVHFVKRIHPTFATWPRWPKGTDHCTSEEYRRNHADACVARIWISYQCVTCHPWCTHRTSLFVKKNSSNIPVAVNNSIKVGPLVFLL